MSFAQALTGTKNNLSDEGQTFLTSWSGLGGIGKSWKCEGSSGIWIRISQEGQVCFLTCTAHLWYHSIWGGLKIAHTSINLSDLCKSRKPCLHCQKLPKCPVFMPWLEAPVCAGRQIPLAVQAQGFPGALRAQNDSQVCPQMLPLAWLQFSCLSPSVLFSFWPAHPTPATFCQPYSSQWSIITFLCSHWWLLEGAALCRCSNWNHNLCSNEYLSRVHHSKWESVNPKSLQEVDRERLAGWSYTQGVNSPTIKITRYY